jgi:hypothetical protein
MRMTTRKRAAVLGLAVALAGLAAGCGGRGDGADADVDDVDLDSPITITDKEAGSFRAPGDGTLTEQQVEMYLKTSLLQFDLVRKHSERLHERVAQMQEREKKGGALAGLRNLADAGRTFVEAGDILGGSYIRSARALGYNPAELEWIRERFLEVGSYLAMKPMHDAAAASARELRASAEKMREEMASGQAPYLSESEINAMLVSAEEMETAAREPDVSGAVLASLANMRKARPALNDAMWTALSFTGGFGGLAFAGLADPNDQEAQEKLDELRKLFEDALANRVSAGMEDAPSGG